MKKRADSQLKEFFISLLKPKGDGARMVLALGLSGLILLFLLLVFMPSYPVVDDIGMMMRVAGLSKVDAPTPMIMNSNTLIGYGLSFLYTQWPDRAWYPLFLLGMLFISGAVFVFAFLKIRSNAKTLILAAVFLYAVVGSFVLGLTFTITAFALGMAGSALTFSLVLRPPRHWAGKAVTAFVAIMLFVLCALLREKVIFLIAFLTAVLLPFIVWKRLDLNALVLGAFVAVSSLGLATLAISYDRQVYQSSPQWSAFWVQKKIKSRFVEMRQIVFTDKTRPKFAACGVTKNDFEMMRTWFFDTRIKNFQIGKIQCLDKAFPHIRNDINWTESVKNSFYVYARHWLIVGFMLSLALMPPVTRRKALVFSAMVILPTLIFLYLDVRFKPAPPRVSLPVFAFSAFAMVLAHISGQSGKPMPLKSWQGVLSLLGVSGLLAVFGVQTRLNLKSSHVTAQRQQKLVEYTHLLAPDPSHLYFLWSGSAFPIEWAAPFGDVRQLFENYHQVGIGGGFNTPLTRQKMRQFNITNPYLDIIDNQNVSIMFQSQRVAGLYLPLYHDFVAINYGRKICHQLQQTVGGIVVYGIKTGGQCAKNQKAVDPDGH